MSARRILIIEDEARIRETARMALATEGYSVETAEDGPEGLALLGSGEGWDLVLLDHRMPGLEGLDVLREMRARGVRTRVLLITAYGSVELARDSLGSGASGILLKPFGPDQLRRAVGEMLAMDERTATEQGAAG